MNNAAEASASNLLGIALMTIGMAAAATSDAVIKTVSSSVEPHHIVTVVGFSSAVIFGLAVKRKGLSLLTLDILHPAALARTILDVVAWLGIVLSLSFASLTIVMTMTQTVPILITLGAILFLGETASTRDWLALMLGLAGMLLIVRPGYADFEPSVLYAVIAAVAMAARDLASRVAPTRITTIQIGAWGGITLGATGLVMSLIISGSPLPITVDIALAFTAIVAFAAVAFYCITSAMRVGSVAAISPIRYSRLVFGASYGVIFFGETISLPMLAGAAIIVGSGLYLLRRELRRKKA